MMVAIASDAVFSFAMQRNGADSKAKMPTAYITGCLAQLKTSMAAFGDH